MELAEFTSTHLEKLLAGLPNVPGTSINNDNRRYIFGEDPSFAQMFLGHDNRIVFVKDTFDLVTSKAKMTPATRVPNGAGALRFICNAADNVLSADQATPFCGTGVGAAQAITSLPNDINIEPKYAFAQSSSITFCPVFFKDFPNIDAVVGSGERTLDKVDCAERILLHEYMHLPWIRDMPGKPDEIGYKKAAEVAKNYNFNGAKKNPDNLCAISRIPSLREQSLTYPACLTVLGLRCTRGSMVKVAKMMHGPQEK